MEATVIIQGMTGSDFWKTVREIVKEENSRLVNSEHPDDLLSHSQIAHIYNTTKSTVSRKISAAGVEQVAEGKERFIKRWQAEQIFRVTG